MAVDVIEKEIDMAHKTNMKVYRDFLSHPKEDSYGHSVFVKDGVLYSCADCIIYGEPIRYFYPDGKPMGLPMANWVDGRMLVNWSWNRACLTAGYHFKAFLYEAIGIDDFKVARVVPADRSFAGLNRLHSINLKSFHDVVVRCIKESKNATLYAGQRLFSAEEEAGEAAKYAAFFGYDKEAREFVSLAEKLSRASSLELDSESNAKARKFAREFLGQAA